MFLPCSLSYTKRPYRVKAFGKVSLGGSLDLKTTAKLPTSAGEVRWVLPRRRARARALAQRQGKKLTNVCSPSEAWGIALTQRELFAHFNLP